MATYSFKNVTASMVGPGINAALGNGAAVADEGITIELAEDKNTMQIGADGIGQHSLHAGQSGTVTVRLLKTSPANAILSTAYNLQTASSSLHGQNTIEVRDTARGDVTVCLFCAFKKLTTLTYAKEAGMNEWRFDSTNIFEKLGSGTN